MNAERDEMPGRRPPRPRRRGLTPAAILVASGAMAGGCQPTAGEAPPAFVGELIGRLEAAPKANPPASVWQYTYGDRTVFYVPPSCCDVPGELYDSTGELICLPDGGFTGDGDGRCPDFFDRRSGERRVWKDAR